MKIVLATSNQGKVNELLTLLTPLGFEIKPQSFFNVPDIEETGLSFIENAILKARHASTITGLPAIADDSGLCINALNGAPGIYSARFAGSPSNAQSNIDKVLDLLKDNEHREAYFYCALVFVNHSEDPTPIIAEGRWDGMISKEKKGETGFGYDPIFYLPALDKTAAEMTKELKNSMSHRAKALQQLSKNLQKLLLVK